MSTDSPSDDLVHRLLYANGGIGRCKCETCSTRREAAEEITRLRAAVSEIAPQSGHEPAQSGHDDKLEEQEFYEMCQRYRYARDVVAAGPGLPTASEAFADLKDWIRQYVRSAMEETWRPMMSAPLDGTEIEILFEHFDYWTCLKLKGKEHADKEYRAAQRAHWIDHNGGGWTWRGMAGSPVGWRPIGRTDRNTG